MLYTTIRDTHLLFEDLKADTPYAFRVRAVNKDGVSEWAEIQVETKTNPLELLFVALRRIDCRIAGVIRCRPD